MKDKLITKIQENMLPYLSKSQMDELQKVLFKAFDNLEVIERGMDDNGNSSGENNKLLEMFISSKRVEGCSEKTLKYYQNTISHLFLKTQKEAQRMTTDDLRNYLADYQREKGISKVTLDNIRRIFSSYFSWLEDEDYISKSPVRRIHRVKSAKVIKETFSDEGLEMLRDNCKEIRDLAMIDLLSSTGMRVGELVKLNRDDIDFNERECVVTGKGNAEREVYFDARAKIHLKNYLDTRTDNDPALFVSLTKHSKRLQIGGVELRVRQLGKQVNLPKTHPHKFRRTLATMAIDKGMPIEQVQKLLGHVKIDTTMHYAMVNQNNVKIAHRKYIG